MNRTTVVRWSVAMAVFLLIGVVDLRFGHTVGLAALILALVVVFVLDLGARRQ